MLKLNTGYLFALMAALANSSSGVVSCMGFSQLDFYQVAFYKCLFAFACLSLFGLISQTMRKQILAFAQNKMQMFILSFLGIFMLFFFETKAFSIAPVGVVAFLVYSAGIVTIILSYFLLHEKITKKTILSVLLICIGAASIMHISIPKGNLAGIIYAILGGLGYSLFLVFCKKFELKANFGFIWWLTGIGTIQLFIPHILGQETLSIPTNGYQYLMFLAITPVICGFYFTTKALSLADANKVQIIEMSEPFLAILLAFLLLGQAMSQQEMIGGILIFIGLVIL